MENFLFLFVILVACGRHRNSIRLKLLGTLCLVCREISPIQIQIQALLLLTVQRAILQLLLLLGARKKCMADAW